MIKGSYYTLHRLQNLLIPSLSCTFIEKNLLKWYDCLVVHACTEKTQRISPLFLYLKKDGFSFAENCLQAQ